MTKPNNIIYLKNDRIHIFETDLRPEMKIRYKGIIDREITKITRICEGEITFRNISNNPNYRQYHYQGELIEIVSDGCSNFIKHGFGFMNDDYGHYEGEWQYDKYHGMGTLKRHDGKILDGEWKDHQFYNGKITQPDGRIFIGNFDEYHQLKGKGKVIFTNGLVFEGRIKHLGKKAFIYGPAKFQDRDGIVTNNFYLFGDTFVNTIFKNPIAALIWYTLIALSIMFIIASTT